MAIFPRDPSPTDSRRHLINETNRLLADYAEAQTIDFMDIGPKLLGPDGTFFPDITNDFCHLTERGYEIWADSLAPLIGAKRLLSDLSNR